MLLGRQQFLALPDISKSSIKTKTLTANDDTVSNDAFFFDLMNLLPPDLYFEQDKQTNWLRSVPNAAKKYHKNVKVVSSTISSKNSLKRAKFTPSAEMTNEEKLIQMSQTDTTSSLLKQEQPRAKNIQELKERLNAKIQSLQQARNTNDKTNTPRVKKVSQRDEKRSVSSIRSKSGVMVLEKESVNDVENSDTNVGSIEVAGDVPELSYGNLLIETENVTAGQKRTRNGQAIRGIKGLLKKAERNEKRMQELKKTETGKEIVESKQWEKAIAQAGGAKCLDDPKLLRRKLKKKEKQKVASGKQWKQRLAHNHQEKARAKQKKAEDSGKVKRNAKSVRSNHGKRPGFEGKKGDKFLNAKA